MPRNIKLTLSMNADMTQELKRTITDQMDALRAVWRDLKETEPQKAQEIAVRIGNLGDIHAQL